MDLPSSLTKLIEALRRLPGIGPKSAQRLAFFILKNPIKNAESLAKAILEVKEKVRYCSICYGITEEDPCFICHSPSRDKEIVCVVEEPSDILAIEKSGGYKGSYHVLQGHLSPLNGIGPEQLKISELVARLKSGSAKELIIATNPNLEGEVTAMYLAKLAKPLGIKVTRLARGLPVGGDLEYADEITLSKSLEGRQEM
jgi:recombination protein RecR